MVLKNKTVIITGASRGIGRAIATLCAREGARVGINYHTSREQAEELVQHLKKTYQAQTMLLGFDVQDEIAIARCCAAVLAEWGSIDGLINNAGINLPGLLLMQTNDQIETQIRTNILGPINCCRAILPHLLQKRSGSIVNIGSITASHVGPGQSVYAATKGAVASLTRALAFEYGRKGIRVNCVEPGPTETEMFEQTRELAGDQIKSRIPLRRFASPEEIAETVIFLLSDKASFITGGSFTVDGGYTLG